MAVPVTRDSQVELSVVIPVYRGAECLDELYRRLLLALEPMAISFELILIEDCGPDESWNCIKSLAASDGRVRGIQFSRNFGQHYGITAGIDVARGAWLVVMDCDLQDRPEEIPRLYAKARMGFDVVLARRVQRRDPLFKRMASQTFYFVFRLLTDLPYDGAVGNFRIISRSVAQAVKLYREQLRFFGGVVHLVGFHTASIEVQHDARFAGETSYPWRKLIQLAGQLITAYSDKPLRVGIGLGFSMSFLALCTGLYYLLGAFAGEIAVTGWASLMVSLYFLSGLIIGLLGLLGLYVGRIFQEVKRRPLYIVRETTFPRDQIEYQ